MQPVLAPAPHILQPAAPDGNVSEQELREQLLAQVRSPPPQHQQHPQQQQQQQQQQTGSPVHHHIHNIDPEIASSSVMSPSAGESGCDDNGSDGRKGSKRELSTSKRAAQNRRAQRAFRQRKEGHIKKLEEQVRDYNLLNENYKAVQAENYQLRDYIINLQSRLIESQGEVPPAPCNINLQPVVGLGQTPPHSQAPSLPDHTTGPSQPPPPMHTLLHPHAAAAAGSVAPTAPMAASAVIQLQASAAQAVADLKTEARRFSGPTVFEREQREGQGGKGKGGVGTMTSSSVA